jgi:hypothetical protein
MHIWQQRQKLRTRYLLCKTYLLEDGLLRYELHIERTSKTHPTNPVFRIQIRMFLGLLDTDPSINKQKNSLKP